MKDMFASALARVSALKFSVMLGLLHISQIESLIIWQHLFFILIAFLDGSCLSLFLQWTD